MTGPVSLRYIKGLGSAKRGVHHWRMQRLTALALAPLSIWLSVSIALLAGTEYEVVVQWVGKPAVTTLLLLTVFALFYHLKLGAQVVIEDYIHTRQLRSCCLVANIFLNITLALVSIISVLRIAL